MNEIEDSQSDERSSILLVELQGSAQAVMLHCVWAATVTKRFEKDRPQLKIISSIFEDSEKCIVFKMTILSFS